MSKYIFFFLIPFGCFSQENVVSTTFFTPEIFIGKIPQVVVGLSYAKEQYIAEHSWQKQLKKPTIGVSGYFTHYGNKEKGNSISILPFIEFPVNSKQNLSMKFGIGISYFDTKYHPIKNPLNNAISSDYTWAIHNAIYYDISTKNKFNYKLGLNYFHHSNGHTKLPNEGLNLVLLSVSTRVFKQAKFQTEHTDNEKQIDIKKYGDWFYTFRYGQGYHAFVNEDSALKKVNSIAVSGGFFYKETLKISIGINYRFYQHYYDYIKTNNTEPYNDNSFKNASNIYISIGAEALLGRVSVDWEGGLNLYKPFYKKHYELQEKKKDLKYKLKKLFLGRLGLKFYAINNNKNPKNNVYIGAHINSNLSQADFSEISIGFVHRIKSK